jgi:hypothetical protein
MSMQTFSMLIGTDTNDNIGGLTKAPTSQPCEKCGGGDWTDRIKVYHNENGRFAGNIRWMFTLCRPCRLEMARLLTKGD